MNLRLRPILTTAAAICVLIGAHGAAHAQYYAAQSAYGSTYQPEPLYPYVVQPQANAYVIQMQPQPAPRAYPYIRPNKVQPPRIASAPKVLKRFASAGKVDRALVEELKQRAEKNPIAKKEIIVREKPIVIEHKRVVDDPPIVVQREQIIDEYHVKSDRPRGLIRHRAEEPAVGAIPPSAPSGPVTLPAPAKGQRVIRAEAEVTILGPDRMSIRLFRKRGEPAPDVAED